MSAATHLQASSPDDISPLLAPYRLGTLDLPNRFVMAPMTRGFSPDGTPGEDVARYYARRAEGGVGLIVTEGVYVDHPTAGARESVPRLEARTVAAWARVVNAAHAAGARIFPQLWHLGATRQIGTPPFPNAPVLSPSGLDLDGKPHGRAFSQSEIDEVVNAFARSAAFAKQAGFDGVELHGAHGYLIDQFLWSETNRRADSYGGEAANRARFAVETIKAVRKAVGPGYPVVLRFSQWKVSRYDARNFATPDEFEALFRPIVEAGVTALHVSVRRYWQPAFEGSSLTLAGWAKKLFGLPVITVGSVGLDVEFVGGGKSGPAQATGLRELLDRFAANEFDLVALGRALISEPRWVEKVSNGESHTLIGFKPEHTKELV